MMLIFSHRKLGREDKAKKEETENVLRDLIEIEQEFNRYRKSARINCLCIYLPYTYCHVTVIL